ncbi:MAG: hypothetical protein OQK51_22550 [Kangiellaceae bacterium]|nr:hypothetical protein [Kangiellaceae bacterium]
MSFNWFRTLIIVLSISTSLTYSLDVFADYKNDYQDAIKRIQQGQFQQGLNLLNRIPEIEQQELRSLTMGNGKPIPYLPKYYKGLAAFNLEQCALAERNFISSLAQQVIKEFETKYNKLKQMREVCRSRLIDGKYVNKLEKLTKTAINKAFQLAKNRNSLNKIKQEPLLKSSWSKSNFFETRLSRTNQQVGAAQREIDKIRLMPYSKENRDYIVRLNSRLSTQLKNSQQFIDGLSNYSSLLRKLKVALQKIDKSLDTLARIKTDEALSDDWQKTGKLTRSLLQLTNEKQDLSLQSKSIFLVTNQEELASAIVTSKVLARKATEINGQLDSLLDYAKNKIASASTVLEKEKKVIYRGVNAFFSGSYGKSIMLLSKAEVQQDKSRYFRNLFIAAAYFYDPKLKESEAIEKASHYIKKAKEIQLEENFDESFFSPRFVKLFREIE